MLVGTAAWFATVQWPAPPVELQCSELAPSTLPGIAKTEPSATVPSVGRPVKLGAPLTVTLPTSCPSPPSPSPAVTVTWNVPAAAYVWSTSHDGVTDDGVEL